MKRELNKLLSIPKRTFAQKKSPDLEIDLIRGSFAPVDAADILLSFVNDKIKFHRAKQLNLTQENNTDKSRSVHRINELQLSKKAITELILMAQNENAQLEINSTITLTLKKTFSSSER